MNNWFLSITSRSGGYAVTSIMAENFDTAMSRVDHYIWDRFKVDVMDLNWTHSSIVHGENSTDFVSSNTSVWVYRDETNGIFASLLPDIQHNV